MKKALLLLVAIWLGQFFVLGQAKAAEGVKGKITEDGGVDTPKVSVWYITRDSNNAPVTAVPVNITQTGSDYEFDLAPGIYEFVYGAAGYECDPQFWNKKEETEIKPGQYTPKHVKLKPSCCTKEHFHKDRIGIVDGEITDLSSGNGIPLAAVYHGGQPHAIASDNPDPGHYSFPHAAGDYIFTYKASGHSSKDMPVRVVNNQPVHTNVPLQ
jgi:hypothetical protein